MAHLSKQQPPPPPPHHTTEVKGLNPGTCTIVPTKHLIVHASEEFINTLLEVVGFLRVPPTRKVDSMG